MQPSRQVPRPLALLLPQITERRTMDHEACGVVSSAQLILAIQRTKEFAPNRSSIMSDGQKCRRRCPLSGGLTGPP